MKKLMILAAIAALTLASCAKIENSAPTKEVAVPIGFTNYTPRTLTKAGDTYVSGSTLVVNKQFAVYAWSTAYNVFFPGTGTNPGTPDFMNPAAVTWKGDTTDGEGNTYTPLRYWPSGDRPDNLTFAAYYPYGGAGITAPTFSTGVGTYAFTAQGAAANMVDFCVADVVNDQVYGNTNAGSSYPQTVKFTFKHQLAKIQFKFKKTDVAATIKLVDAKLLNVRTSGTLTATYTKNANPAVNALGTTNTEWSAQAVAGTPVEYDITINGTDVSTSNKVELTTTASTVVDNDLFLMIPQNMVTKTGTNPQALVVTWEVTSGGVTTTNTKTLYFKDDLKNGDNPTESGYATEDIDWEKNNFITYTITIGPKPIYFTATVENWDNESNGYFNVQ